MRVGGKERERGRERRGKEPWLAEMAERLGKKKGEKKKEHG